MFGSWPLLALPIYLAWQDLIIASCFIFFIFLQSAWIVTKCFWQDWLGFEFGLLPQRDANVLVCVLFATYEVCQKPNNLA